MPKDVEIHIDELVLHGLPHIDRSCIAGAIEREIVHLFNEHGIPPSLTKDGEIDLLDGAAFEVPIDKKPDIIGRHVAGSVFKGMSR